MTGFQAVLGSYGIKCQNDDPTTFTEISNNLIYNIGAYGLNPGVSCKPGKRDFCTVMEEI